MDKEEGCYQERGVTMMVRWSVSTTRTGVPTSMKPFCDLTSTSTPAITARPIGARRDKACPVSPTLIPYGVGGVVVFQLGGERHAFQYLGSHKQPYGNDEHYSSGSQRQPTCRRTQIGKGIPYSTYDKNRTSHSSYRDTGQKEDFEEEESYPEQEKKHYQKYVHNVVCWV